MTALIQIDDGGGAVTGSIEAPAATVCTFSNVDNTGVLGWFWELVDKPAGSAAALSSATVAAPTMTVDLPGTYLVRLSTYFDAARTLFDDTDLQGVGVRYVAPYAWRLPAAHETTQFDATDGWKAEVNAILDTVRTGLTAAVGATLQAAYDGGQAIDQTATAAPIAITSGTSVVTLMTLTRNTNGAAPVMTIGRAPGSAQTGEGLITTMGANSLSSAIVGDHSGTGVAIQGLAHGAGASAAFTTDAQLGYGVYVTMSDLANANDGLTIQHDGLGRGLVAGTASGTVAYLQVNVEAGVALHAYDAINTEDLFYLANTGCILGSAVQPIGLTAYSFAGFNGEVSAGSAVDATLKCFTGFTTTAGTATASTNNKGQLLWRAGTNTAASTIADLAHRAGSGSEVLLTKGGRVFAEADIFEWPIANGVTLAAGEAIAVKADERVQKANAIAAAAPGFIGICLVGGTGDAGGTVYALVATSGVVRGLSGLTAGSPVYLSVATAGAITPTVPTGAGNLSLQIGQALSTTVLALHVEGRMIL